MVTFSMFVDINSRLNKAEFFYILRSVWVVLASNAGQNLLFVNCGCKGKVLE